MEADHARLEALLDGSVAHPDRFDHHAFERFRGGLLRHIGIEEKILMADARARRGGVPLPLASTIRCEHGALASLLVPTPDHALVNEIRSIMTVHNPREEGPDGLYARCEALAGDEVPSLLDKVRAAPDVPTAPHHDGPRATRTAAAALARSRMGRRPRSFEPRRPAERRDGDGVDDR